MAASEQLLEPSEARQLAQKDSPPLTLEDEVFTLFLDICDIHQRRNVNRSIEQMMAGWPEAQQRSSHEPAASAPATSRPRRRPLSLGVCDASLFLAPRKTP